MTIPAWVDYDPDLSAGASDWHAVYTVQLGELIEDGVFDFSDSSWDFDSFDAAQRTRLWGKFTARYEFYEIGLVPPGRWQKAVLSKLNEIMPKYKPLYQAIKDGYNPLQDSSERHRERDIYSEFPQTELNSAIEDYASNGTEQLYETIRDGNLIDKAYDLRNRYSDVDAMILDELDYLFIQLTTANVNGF